MEQLIRFLKTVASDRLLLRVRGIILTKRKKTGKIYDLCEGYMAFNTVKIASGQKIVF